MSHPDGFQFLLGRSSDETDVSSDSSADAATLELRATVRELREFLRVSHKKILDDEEEESAREDWHFVAMVIDRFVTALYYNLF